MGVLWTWTRAHSDVPVWWGKRSQWGSLRLHRGGDQLCGLGAQLRTYLVQEHAIVACFSAPLQALVCPSREEVCGATHTGLSVYRCFAAGIRQRTTVCERCSLLRTRPNLSYPPPLESIAGAACTRPDPLGSRLPHPSAGKSGVGGERVWACLRSTVHHSPASANLHPGDRVHRSRDLQI